MTLDGRAEDDDNDDDDEDEVCHDGAWIEDKGQLLTYQGSDHLIS